MAIKDLKDIQLAILIFRLQIGSLPNKVEILRNILFPSETCTLDINPFMKFLFWNLAKNKPFAVNSILAYFGESKEKGGILGGEGGLGRNEASESQGSFEEKLGIVVAGNSSDLVLFAKLLKEKPEFKAAFGEVEINTREFKVRSWVKTLLEFNQSFVQGISLNPLRTPITRNRKPQQLNQLNSHTPHQLPKFRKRLRRLNPPTQDPPASLPRPNVLANATRLAPIQKSPMESNQSIKIPPFPHR